MRIFIALARFHSRSFFVFKNDQNIMHWKQRIVNHKHWIRKTMSIPKKMENCIWVWKQTKNLCMFELSSWIGNVVYFRIEWLLTYIVISSLYISVTVLYKYFVITYLLRFIFSSSVRVVWCVIVMYVLLNCNIYKLLCSCKKILV